MRVTGNKAYEQLQRIRNEIQSVEDSMERIPQSDLPNLYPLIRKIIKLADERIPASFGIVGSISLNESDLVFPTRSKFSGVFDKVIAATQAGFDDTAQVVDAIAVSGYQTITNSEGTFSGATAITDGTYNLKVTLNGTLYEINTGALEAADITGALAGLETDLQTKSSSGATIEIDTDDKIRVTGYNDGVYAGTVLVEDGDTDGFIAALTAETGITAVLDDSVDGTDATIKEETITIIADVAGEAGNATLTGDGTTDIATLVAALSEDYTVVAGGAEVLYDEVIVEISGGADETTGYSTFVTIIADTTGDKDTKITGDGSDDLDTLVAAEVENYTVLGDGTQIPALDEEINIDTGGAGVGDTIQLTAFVDPYEADDKTVEWTSSDESVATVDDEGLVTLVANGSAQITATTNDGALTASCNITIVA